MPTPKDKVSKSKKEKKLIKLIANSESDDDESEHELSHYVNDRVKLMKQVLKVIKPKKIRAMAPECLQNLDNEEINSMLLEELLGISNKRLKYIFAGQNVDEDTSSSTDPEEDRKPIDIISLDDISDDDFIIDVDSPSESTRKHKNHKKIKQEPPEKKIKKEHTNKKKKTTTETKSVRKEKSEEENLMSVLELLELQARARAIRSQLLLEANKKAQEEQPKVDNQSDDNDDDDDAVIIESPTCNEIVITSSESEDEGANKKENTFNNKMNAVEENGSSTGTNNGSSANKKDKTGTDKRFSEKEISEKQLTDHCESEVIDLSDNEYEASSARKLDDKEDNAAQVDSSMTAPKSISNSVLQIPSNEGGNLNPTNVKYLENPKTGQHAYEDRIDGNVNGAQEPKPTEVQSKSSKNKNENQGIITDTENKPNTKNNELVSQDYKMKGTKDEKCTIEDQSKAAGSTKNMKNKRVGGQNSSIDLNSQDGLVINIDDEDMEDIHCE